MTREGPWVIAIRKWPKTYRGRFWVGLGDVMRTLQRADVVVVPPSGFFGLLDTPMPAARVLAYDRRKRRVCVGFAQGRENVAALARGFRFPEGSVLYVDAYGRIRAHLDPTRDRGGDRQPRPAQSRLDSGRL